MEEGVRNVTSGDQVDNDPDLVLIQVRIPDLHAEKCLQFSKEERVWDVKQQILAVMPKELEDSFNYGLFQPPSNGRAGKFLDEERRLSEYPFQASVGHLELKFKRRVYKMLNLDEKQLKQMNSKSSLKKFLEHVMSNNVEKVTKMCNKGLDPNFHCQESGETPLSLISGIKSRPSRMVMALVNGGAILDFRTKDGSTAMHRAVVSNNIEAVRTMLELGASPNYRDSKNLTPLYHSVVTVNTDPSITETLLHDHAHIGAQDLQGWQEVHQVCRSGMLQHLEHLLFYGADMNARNASGNTPLHVCAVNNQDTCARMLLFRGADKECLNFAGQTAYQVAVIAGNLELAEVIQNHTAENVVPFKEAPKYNPRRKVSGVPLSRTMSDCGSFHYESLSLRRGESPLTGNYIMGKVSSPSLSDRSLPPFSSGSSISETSTGSGSSQSHDQEDQLDSASTLAGDHTSDIVSLSSGVGTGSSNSGGSAATPTEIVLMPGMMVVSLENYSHPTDQSHLKLSQGDVIEVLASTDSGLLEGKVRGQTGYFPREIVEEVRLRSATGGAVDKQKYFELRGGTMTRAQSNAGNQKYFGTTVRGSNGKIGLSIGHPRSCVLHKGKKGFGFVLRGAKAASPLMDMIPSDRCPSLQYMDDVDPGGVADMAGISKGDFLLAINGEDVTQASHERVVTLIRQSGDLVSLTVVTVTPELGPGSMASPMPPHQKHFSTLPRKMPGVSGVRSPLQQPPPPPKRDPTTTLSVGRARAKSMLANLAAIDALDSALKENDKVKEVTASEVNGHSVAQELELIFKRESGLTVAGSQAKTSSSVNSSPALSKKKVYNSVAQMKRSNKNGGIDLNNLHKDYHSTPDLQTQSGREKVEPEHDNATGTKDLDQFNRNAPRRIHSQEDLHLLSSKDSVSGVSHHGSNVHPAGYFTLPHKKSSRSGPAPVHPPPPPPAPGTTIYMAASRSNGSYDYAKLSPKTQEAPASSFNPSSSARLYESPKDVANIGYTDTVPTNNQTNGIKTVKKSPTRTNSLPSRPRPMVLKRIEEPLTGPSQLATETYSVNGVNYTTYTTFRSPITPDECDGSVSNRLLCDDDTAETPTTPTNEGYRDTGAGEPHIPEPDYDMSDQDTDTANQYSNGGDNNGSTATLRRRGRSVRSNTDTERKKKKTVSFIMNEELANIIHSSGTMTKRDSILKDPSRERDESKSRPAAKRSPSKVSAPPVASDPVHTSPSIKATQHPAWQGGSIMADSQQEPKLVSTSRIRIEVGNNSNNNGSTSKLQKSQSFSAVLSPMSDQASAMHQSSAAASSQSGISQDDLQKARSALKSSRSFPELLEDGDNSSSGVSSDQDQDTIIVCEQVNSKQDYVTKLTVSDKRSAQSGSPRSADKSVTMTGPIGPVNIEWSGQDEDQEHHYQNFASMMKTNYRSRNASDASNGAGLGDHVNVRRPFPASKTDTMTASYHGQLADSTGQQHGGSCLMSQSMISDPTHDNRQHTIEHSLALIRHHVKGLNDVGMYGGVPPPPPSDSNAITPPVCPPPPGFSDSDSMSEDNDSLTSDPGSFNRFGFSRVSRQHSLAAHDKWRQDRLMPQAQYAGGARKSASGILESSSGPNNYLAGSLQKEFQGRNLLDWNVTDVADWLDSLLLSEYKASFVQASINGYRLSALNTEAFDKLGVNQTSHRLKIQKSMKRFMMRS